MTDAKIVELESDSSTRSILACPLQISVIDPDGRLWPQLQSELQSSQLQLRRLSEQEALPKPGRQVLLLVDHPMISMVYDELERRSAQSPPVIVVGDPSHTALMRRSMRLGAVDFLPFEYQPAELWSALTRVADKLAASARLAPVTVVVNGKPGSGASFICANLGYALSQTDDDDKVLLVDANLHYGSLADYLNVHDKQGSLASGMLRATEMDAMALSGMVSPARERLDVLPSLPPSLTEHYVPTAKSCSQLMYLLRSQYQQVVVDLSRGPESWNLPVLECADHVLVVMQQSLSALRETMYLLKRLRHELGIPKGRIILLINRYDKRKDLTLKKIEQTTEITHILTLLNDFTLAENCTDLGKLVVEIEKKHKLVKVFEDIVDEIKPQDAAAVTKPGLLKRWFGQG
ncbi:AAA family ATPase [Oceanisphaera psychrotolerans]|uniref:Pilus assembly protein CpaF n=1 Tax=Oceanisphaera psychrotolerans TaxID=1414654 RepID=A0A1J4QB98_9GAMM|nr:pilus assembly protein CpaF [Oceanisphaera psychrotolerans]OIN06631.1 pilus assembly protein CpaF [Oceanisphaera psychrotolerans]